MKFISSREGDALVIKIKGELDHHCSKQVREGIDKLLCDGTISDLIFDFEKLQFMDSSGIGVIMGRYKLLQERNGRVFVRNMSNQVKRVFNVSGLYRIIEILD